ncbi:hypothetical protein QN277_016499 [Acacia crassicarpa]|nr:hypothetical protein QN277_016499 [Acacia crassicarpa]
MGTEATEAVVLPHIFEKNEVHWNPEAFLKMCWLRLLIISCNLDQLLHLKGLPGTWKVLHWYGYPLETLPFKENKDQLVYLKMQNS